MNVIEVAGLTHRYGFKTSLAGGDLQVPEGAVYTLLGPNGGGKSPVLGILMGLQHQAAGTIRIFGRERARLTVSDRLEIGYVAEGQRLPREMTLRALEAYLSPLYPSWDVSLANDLRERFRLDATQRIGTYSKGQYMKAALLCALAPRPRLLVMDQPFTGMDVGVRDELVRGVLLGVGNDKMTVLVSSHDVGDLEMICDWVGFLDRGRLTISKPIDDLREET